VPDALRVAVLGPGGVGGLLGALLARRSAHVVCLARPQTVAELQCGGISVESARFGDFSVPVEAAERLTEPVDVCLVTVKATQLEAALDRLPAQVLRGALVVPLLNGVEHVALLRERYPAASVLAATIRVESTRLGPGRVRHDSPFASVTLAGGDGPVSPEVRRFADLLQGAGLDVEVDGDERAVLWAKLSFLAPLALLTTHANAPAGVVRQQRRDELVALVGEVAAVARAVGAGAAVDEQSVLALFEQIPATMQSSMQRDAAAGRATEVDAIGGSVLRAAARHGIPVPVTARLVQDLSPSEP
jgi:2-dehydropantoate 2-reductase